MVTDKVAFVRLPPFLGYKRPHPQNLVWPLEAGHMATVLDRLGHEVVVIDAWVDRLTPDGTAARIVDARPDVVAIETATPTVGLARQIIHSAKSRHPFIAIAHGQHATAMPETVLKDGCFLACIEGEGERTLPELLSALARGGRREEVPGVAWYDGGILRRSQPRGLIEDLDSLPFLDYALLPRRHYYMASTTVPRFRRQRWGFMMSSRGCPFRCIYCSPTLRLSYGSKYRAHSAEYVVDNCEYLARGHGANALMFLDDVFTFDRERTLRICALLRRRRLGVPWVCQTRADCLDPALVREMRDAGCVGVCMGVESGSERILKVLHKDMTKSQIRGVVAALHEVGISPTLFFMVGNPTETYAEFQETVRFVRELKPLVAQVAYFTPYPGSPVFEELQRRSPASVGDEMFHWYSHYNSPSFNFSAMPDDVFRRLQSEFYKGYYLSPGYVRAYAMRRLPYMMFSPQQEWALIRGAIAFLLRREPRRPVGREAGRPAGRDAGGGCHA